MSGRQEWTRAEVVAWLAEQGRPIEPGTWSSYVTRGRAPQPRHVGRTPLWAPGQVRAWHASSPGQGTGGGGPRTGPRHWTRDEVLAYLAEQGRPMSPRAWAARVRHGSAPAQLRPGVWSAARVRAWHDELATAAGGTR